MFANIFRPTGIPVKHAVLSLLELVTSARLAVLHDSSGFEMRPMRLAQHVSARLNQDQCKRTFFKAHERRWVPHSY